MTDSGDIDRLQLQVGAVQDEVLTLRVDLTGKDGTNGKLGNLKTHVHRQWWIIGILLTAALTAFDSSVWALVDKATAAGSDRARIDRAEHDLDELRGEVETLRADLQRVRVSP